MSAVDFWNSHIRDIIEAVYARRSFDVDGTYESRIRIPDAPEADSFAACPESALDAVTESRLHSEP